MKTMKLFSFCQLFLVIGFSSQQLYAQKYRVLRTNTAFEKVRHDTNFDCLHENFDTTLCQWVADYHVQFDTILPGTIEAAFKGVWERANRLGANSFIVRSSDLYTEGEPRYFDISVYWLRMENRDSNKHMFYSGDVYMFGFLGHHIMIDGYEVYRGEEEMLIQELSYHQFDMAHDDKVIIRIGNRSRGETFQVHADHNTLPEYLYFQQSIGAFQNAWIAQHEWNFAEFLIRVLKKA
jgi:hypothetical protein